MLLFDELLREGQVDATRLDSCGAVSYELQEGEYELLTMEPYALRYLTVIAQGEGEVRLLQTGLRRVGFPVIDKTLNSTDPVEQEIFTAAIETFRQNTADIYMDCPSRERAGWLCDSYFTAQSEQYFTGNGAVETAFIDNFV